MTSLWQAERMVTCDFPCRKNKCCCGAHITLPSLVFERTDFVFLFPKPIVVKNSPSVIDKYMKYSQCFFFHMLLLNVLNHHIIRHMLKLKSKENTKGLNHYRSYIAK